MSTKPILTNGLSVLITENEEKLYFNGPSMDMFSFSITKKSLENIGTFFVNLLNKRNDIISFFDKILLNLSKLDISIYDSTILYDIADKEKHIDRDFLVFYLYTLNEIIRSRHDLYETSLKTGLLKENYMFCSSDSCKNDVINRVELDKLIFLNSIDILEYCLGIDKKYYTKGSINFMSSEMEIPKCRKILCIEKANRYFDYTYIIKSKDKKLLEEINKSKRSTLVKFYEIDTFKELIDLFVDVFLEKSIDLRKCENCGKYFISENGIKYCNNPSPQDKKKSCKEIGSRIKYENKEITLKYNKLVNRYRSKIRVLEEKNNRTKSEYEDLKKFKVELEKLREEYGDKKSKKINDCDFEKWLDTKTQEYKIKYMKKSKNKK